MTREDEFTTTAIAELVRESCDEFYGDDTVLTDGVVERFEELLDKALDGKVLVEVEAHPECEHQYHEVRLYMMGGGPASAGGMESRCVKCGEPEAAGEGE